MQLLPLRKNSATWDSIGYHVSDDARRLLLHGSLHSLAQGAEVRGIGSLQHACPCTPTLPASAKSSHQGAPGSRRWARHIKVHQQDWQSNQRELLSMSNAGGRLIAGGRPHPAADGRP